MLHEDWQDARGLAEDVRRYGAWMRAEAEQRIGHLYPKVTVTAEMATDRPDLKPLVGQSLTVIAWLWARTVKSPNPVFSHVDVPLTSSFLLSTKDGKDAYVEPVVQEDSYRFEVRLGTPTPSAENPEEWQKAFSTNKMLGVATVDRLMHGGAYSIVLEGRGQRSHRTPADGCPIEGLRTPSADIG